ncbi:DeSI-like protein At4g17486 [Linum perenne]
MRGKDRSQFSSMYMTSHPLMATLIGLVLEFIILEFKIAPLDIGMAVHNVEYAFGAHEYPTTGIFEGVPKQCEGFTFRKSILIGKTELGTGEVRKVMEDLAHEYRGNAYNLITKNCNHFCNAACLKLTSNPIPSWVNRLARIGFLCNCVLPSHICSTKVRHDSSSSRAEEDIKPPAACHDDVVVVVDKRLRDGAYHHQFASSSETSSSPPTIAAAATTTNGHDEIEHNQVRGRSRTRQRRGIPPSSPLVSSSSSSLSSAAS